MSSESVAWGRVVSADLFESIRAVGDGDCGFHSIYICLNVNSKNIDKYTKTKGCRAPASSLKTWKEDTFNRSFDYLISRLSEEDGSGRAYFKLGIDREPLAKMYGDEMFTLQAMCASVSRFRHSNLKTILESAEDPNSVAISIWAMKEYVKERQCVLGEYSTPDFLKFASVSHNIRVMYDIDSTGTTYREILKLPPSACESSLENDIFIRHSTCTTMDNRVVGHFDSLVLVQKLYAELYAVGSTKDHDFLASMQTGDVEDDNDPITESDDQSNLNFPDPNRFEYDKKWVINTINMEPLDLAISNTDNPLRHDILRSLKRQIEECLVKVHRYAEDNWTPLMDSYGNPREGLCITEIMDFMEEVKMNRRSGPLSTPPFRDVVKELSDFNRETENGKRNKLFPFPIVQFNEWENLMICMKCFLNGSNLDTFAMTGELDLMRVLCPASIDFFLEPCMRSCTAKIRRVMEKLRKYFFPPVIKKGVLVPWEDYAPITVTFIGKAGGVGLPIAKPQLIHEDHDYSSMGRSKGVQPASFFLAGHHDSYIGIVESTPTKVMENGVEVSYWDVHYERIPPGWAMITMGLHGGGISPSFFTFNMHCYLDGLLSAAMAARWRVPNTVYPLNSKYNQFKYHNPEIAAVCKPTKKVVEIEVGHEKKTLQSVGTSSAAYDSRKRKEVGKSLAHSREIARLKRVQDEEKERVARNEAFRLEREVIEHYDSEDAGCATSKYPDEDNDEY